MRSECYLGHDEGRVAQLVALAVVGAVVPRPVPLEVGEYRAVQAGGAEAVTRDGAVIVAGGVLRRLGGQGRDHGRLPLHHLKCDLLAGEGGGAAQRGEDADL